MKKRTIDKGIGQRLQAARKAAGYTQEQLAEKLDMSTKNLSAVERGVSGLSIESLCAVCRELGVSADEILFEKPSTEMRTQVERISEHLAALPAEHLQITDNILKNLFRAFRMEDNEK